MFDQPFIPPFSQVLFGSGLLTPQIQTAALSLLAGQLPSDWTHRWEAGAPEKPQSWLRELVRKRVVLGSKWMGRGSGRGGTGTLLEPCESILFIPMV